MKISSMFKLSTFLIVVLTCGTPFVTFAQQNSGQTDAEAAARQDANTVSLKIKSAAESDASSDVNRCLWFGIGASGFCLGGIVGGFGGYGIGSIIDPEWESSYFGYCALPSTAQTVGMLIGATIVGISGPIITAYRSMPNPPPERLLGKSPEYIEVYTEAYRKKARSLQTKSAAIGVAALPVLLFFGSSL